MVRTNRDEELARLEIVSSGWPEEIEHPLHAQHPLLKALRPDYSCDGCKLHKADEHWSYHCAACDFDLHPECVLLIPATVDVVPEPETLRHRLHQEHPLVKTPRRDAFWCDACAKKGHSCSFSCEACGFHLHPDCAEEFNVAVLPERLVHEMVRTRRGAYRCSSCKEEGRGWSYHCEHGDLDLHPRCGVKMRGSGGGVEQDTSEDAELPMKRQDDGETADEMTAAERQAKTMRDADAEQAKLITAMAQFQMMKMQTDAMSSITSGAMDSAARVQNMGRPMQYWRDPSHYQDNFFTPSKFFRPY